MARANERGAAIPMRPMVTIGSGISSWMKLTTGEKDETAVLRLKASRAIVIIATYLATEFFKD